MDGADDDDAAAAAALFLVAGAFFFFAGAVSSSSVPFKSPNKSSNEADGDSAAVPESGVILSKISTNPINYT